MKLLRLAVALLAVAAAAAAQQRPIVLEVSTLLDGKGHELHNTRVVVQDGKIVAVDPKAQGEVYDLRGLTVMPALIDAHVHITWHFGPNGKFGDRNETKEQATYAIAANAWDTLMGGFTTIQSLGSPEDAYLRAAVEKGEIPGPRVITALQPWSKNGEGVTDEQLKQYIDKEKQDGADVIKIFASKSIRDGGGPTLTEHQLSVLCGEAKAVGLRSVVHAYYRSVHDATVAGCTEVEHGTGATDDELKLMAEKGVYFDPQACLVIKNYLEHKQQYLGVGNYTEAGFAAMEKALPEDIALYKRSIAVPGLKVIFGTDATAGAAGHNAEELICRVNDSGQKPMDALVGAQSLAAEALRIGDQVGSIAPGMQADIIALDGDPLKDITAVRKVVFVMRKGVIYKNHVVAHSAK